MKLIGPVGVLGTADEAMYAARQIAMCGGRGITISSRADVLRPFVSGGRWVADCPSCGAGISVHRAWPVARCMNCGSTYATIDWPEHFDEIEALLAPRQVRLQDWTDETVETLKAENTRLGIMLAETGDGS